MTARLRGEGAGYVGQTLFDWGLAPLGFPWDDQPWHVKIMKVCTGLYECSYTIIIVMTDTHMYIYIYIYIYVYIYINRVM